jgi:hypothetical protein
VTERWGDEEGGRESERGWGREKEGVKGGGERER